MNSILGKISIIIHSFINFCPNTIDVYYKLYRIYDIYGLYYERSSFTKTYISSKSLSLIDYTRFIIVVFCKSLLKTTLTFHIIYLNYIVHTYYLFICLLILFADHRKLSLRLLETDADFKQIINSVPCPSSHGFSIL